MKQSNDRHGVNPGSPRSRVGFACLLGLLAAGMPRVDAQEQPLRVDLMPLSLDSPVALFYRNKGEVTKLEAFHSAMGTPVFYRGPALLAFYRSAEEAQPPPDGQEAPEPAATVRLPSGSRRVLLVFTAGEAGAKPSVRSYGVADDKLRAGDYRIFNLASTPVLGLLGSNRIALRPGQSTDVSDPSWRERGHDLEVQFAVPRDDRPKVVYSTIWGHQPARRNYVFAIGGADPGGSIEIRRFHDVPGVPSVGFEPDGGAADSAGSR